MLQFVIFEAIYPHLISEGRYFFQACDHCKVEIVILSKQVAEYEQMNNCRISENLSGQWYFKTHSFSSISCIIISHRFLLS